MTLCMSLFLSYQSADLFFFLFSRESVFGCITVVTVIPGACIAYRYLALQKTIAQAKDHCRDFFLGRVNGDYPQACSNIC